jgi:nitrite reductase/ring-hydroxylating ferredoxin subunit
LREEKKRQKKQADDEATRKEREATTSVLGVMNSMFSGTNADCQPTPKVQQTPHRFITVVDAGGGVLRAFDSICYHAGGPLGIGDIEEIGEGIKCIKCPWHAYLIDLETGTWHDYLIDLETGTWHA